MHDANRVRQLLHKEACATRVIEVNVREENVVDIRNAEALLLQRVKQERNTVVRSSIHERSTTALYDQVTRILQGSRILSIDGGDAII